MLLKDDLFEVVFDPGADKREKRILSPITRLPGDTGRARLSCIFRVSSDPKLAPLGDQAADRARLNCSSLLGFGPAVNESVAMRASRARKAAAVDTPTAGTATTQGVTGRSGRG